MKYLFKTIFFATAIMTMAAFASFAETERVDNLNSDFLPENAVDVVITADVPEYYNMKIDVMINDIDFDLKYREDMENNGYTRTYPISAGVYDVTVFSNEDINDEYTYEVSPKTLDTSKCQNVKIKVKSLGKDIEAGEEDNHEEDESISPLVVEPEVIDLSDGKTYGTFRVKLVSYEAAITHVTYQITDGKTVYDIDLKRDYNFAADVLLPVGSYYELGSPNFELDERAAWNNEIRCTWSHKYNRGTFGNYYEIVENNTTLLDDLEIMMIQRGDVFPFDSYMLFQPMIKNERDALIESHAQAIQESLNETTETTEAETEETETIAELKPIEDTTSVDIGRIIAIAGAVAAILIASVAVVLKLKKK